MAFVDSKKNCLLVLEQDAKKIIALSEHLNTTHYKVVQCSSSIDELCSLVRRYSNSVLVVDIDCEDTVETVNAFVHCPEYSTLPVVYCSEALEDDVYDRVPGITPFAWLPYSCPPRMFENTIGSACYFSSLGSRYQRMDEKYQLIAQNIPEGLVLLDEQWRIDFANDKLVQLVEARDSLEGVCFEQLLDDETALRLRAAREMLYTKSEQAFQGYLFTSTDHSVPVWFSVSRISANNGLLCVVTNLEEHLQVEAALRETEARYRTLYQNAVEGIFRIQESGTIIEANPAFNRILGFDIADWSKGEVRHNLSDRFVNTSEFSRLVEQVQTVGRQSKYLAQLIRNDGTSIWGEISAHWNIDPKDQVPYVEGMLSDITERRRAELDLERRATRDSLTGVYSRECFVEKLGSILSTAGYTNTVFAVLFLDVDNFKEVNDTYGHHSGDIVLKEFVRRVNAQIREGDIFGRIGGDEFCIVLEGIRSVADANAVADKIRSVVTTPVPGVDASIKIGVSIGVSTFPEDGNTPEGLLAKADQAMYLDKRS